MAFAGISAGTAAGIAAGVGAVGSVAGAGISAAGASSAANQTRKSLNQGYGIASKTLGQNDRFLGDLYWPYVGQANTYQTRLNDELLGGSLSQPYDWNRYQGDAGLAPGVEQSDFLTQYGLDDFKGQYGVDLRQTMQPTAAFDPTNIQIDPGYKWRLGQGMQAMDRSAAAKGGVLSGGQGKALQRYAQDYASGEYQNAYDRASQTYGLNAANQNTYRGQALGQFNTAADQRAQNNTLNLSNYLDNAKLSQIQNAQKYDQLAGMYNTSLGQVNNFAAGRSGNAAQMANYGTGAATAQGQNAWNKAGANSSAWGGAMGNLSNLAGMYMLYQGAGLGSGTGNTGTANKAMDAAANSTASAYGGLFKR
jgi:hypothetical protein